MRAVRLLLVVALGAGMAFAQSQAKLAAGTRVNAKLQSSLNAQQAKVGDRVSAVTTSAVKEHGKVVLPKGTRLSGRVTSVLAAKDEHSPSRIGVLFDQATTAQGETTPVHLAVMSVTQAAAGAAAMQPMPMMPPPMPVMAPPSPMASGAAGGGLNLGGAVGGLGAAAGGALGAAANTRTMAMPMPMPRISVGSGAEAGAGSTLSVPQGNLILHSGTQVKLISTAGGGGQ
ncbi:MAG: hypothetical protein EPN33_14425 [Acidobacteria bacterium]|nr:MAG: hypothetical protein EPN33_14425 [Acidobacteriota bacterium]